MLAAATAARGLLRDVLIFIIFLPLLFHQGDGLVRRSVFVASKQTALVSICPKRQILTPAPGQPLD
jgi:hypothetical protein